MGNHGCRGPAPLRITRLIAALYGAVTDSHAYFIVLKYSIERGRVAAVMWRGRAKLGCSYSGLGCGRGQKPELGASGVPRH